MLKLLTSITAGTFGFVATTETAQAISNHVNGNSNAYIYGIIASGIIQIILKLIEIKSKKKSL